MENEFEKASSEKATGRDYGLSRKSNVAGIAIGAIGFVKDSIPALIAVVVIALVSITYQAVLDWFDKDDSY